MGPVPAQSLSLKGRALRLLSQREHSRAELERKLARHEADAEAVGRALDELQARGFINEARVADSVIHRRAARLGTQRVAQELRAKGLSSEAVAQAVDGLRATEFERAREVWRKRFGAPPADAAERARQARFLAARGFSGEVVRKLVSGGPDDDC